MSSSYRLELERWLKSLDIHAGKVIDVGGSQFPVKGRTNTWEVKQYRIYDLAQPHADSPQPDHIFNIEDLYAESDELADVIFCLEVFDYLVLPNIAMTNIKHLLYKGGLAYVSFPFFYPTHQPLEHEGLRYTERSIYRLAEIAGLEIVTMERRRPESNLLDQFFRAERMRAAKHYDHYVTGWLVTFRKPS